MKTFVRTVLGDIDPHAVGTCDAHEHVWIGQCYATARHPDFLLDDAELIVQELKSLKQAGVDWVIDCMPGGAGRDVRALAEVSLRSGVAIVASTGLHLSKYYPPDHPILWADKGGLAERFAQDIEGGADDSQHRCGIIKVSGGLGSLSDLERVSFLAAARVHRTTGAPIITHTEAGSAAMEQVDLLVDQGGCDPSKVTLSHVDRVEDADYHRALLRRGVNLEYDGHFRLKNRNPNPTVELIATLLPEFPNQIVVGMDAARSSYWASFGGAPGLTYFATTLRSALVSRGVEQPLLDRLYVQNARRAFSFAEVL